MANRVPEFFGTVSLWYKTRFDLFYIVDNIHHLIVDHITKKSIVIYSHKC